VIFDAMPGARVYAGLKPGMNRSALAREIAAGRTAECLHSFEPQAGDCVFIPAGTVHALGAGLLVAEIQQASDTTYRLFDWNRVGPDDRPRTLHVEQALGVIDYSAGAVGPQRPQATDRPYVERLVECDKFVLDRWRQDRPVRLDSLPQGKGRGEGLSLGGDGRCHIVSVLEGTVDIGWEGDAHAGPSAPLSCGQTILLPASLGAVLLSPRTACALLDMYLPG
jgi:mannose-6-phosphate isomerase